MSSLSQAQVEAIFRYGVGVGSEGPVPGLALAGWAQNGSGQFNANGTAANSNLINQNSGYSAGTLQWDFGQQNSGQYANVYNGFIQSFLASPQAQTLSSSDITAIL